MEDVLLRTVLPPPTSAPHPPLPALRRATASDVSRKCEGSALAVGVRRLGPAASTCETGRALTLSSPSSRTRRRAKAQEGLLRGKIADLETFSSHGADAVVAEGLLPRPSSSVAADNDEEAAERKARLRLVCGHGIVTETSRHETYRKKSYPN